MSAVPIDPLNVEGTEGFFRVHHRWFAACASNRISLQDWGNLLSPVDQKEEGVFPKEDPLCELKELYQSL